MRITISVNCTTTAITRMKPRRAQIGDVQRDQDIVLHQMEHAAGETSSKVVGQSHADGGFQLAGDAHEGQRPRNFTSTKLLISTVLTSKSRYSVIDDGFSGVGGGII